MNDTSISLIKGSGTVLNYTNKDPTTGIYTPQDRDRNSLVRNADGTWTETQPDGFQLFYALLPTSGSGSGSASASGSVVSGSRSGSASQSGSVSGSMSQSGSGCSACGVIDVSNCCSGLLLPAVLYGTIASETGGCVGNPNIPSSLTLTYSATATIASVAGCWVVDNGAGSLTGWRFGCRFVFSGGWQWVLLDTFGSCVGIAQIETMTLDSCSPFQVHVNWGQTFYCCGDPQGGTFDLVVTT